MNKLAYEIIKREPLYEGRFTLVCMHVRHQLFKGGWSGTFSREVLERTPAVAILPYDPKLDRVILIEQFRVGALQRGSESPWLIEIPAGIIDTTETPEQVAIREAQEEAGCDIKNIKLLYDYFVSPGGSNEYLHVFYGEIDATNVNGIHGLQNENEDIRVLNLSFEEAFAKLQRGEIRTPPAIVALQWLALCKSKI